MKNKRLEIIGFGVYLLFLVVACTTQQTAKPAATAGQSVPLTGKAAATDAATGKADTATAAVDTKATARDGKVRADVQHARTANQANPDGQPKTEVEGDLSVADSNLSDVPPDPTETAAREHDKALVESGKATEARASYVAAVADAKKTSEDLVTTKAVAAQAIAERDTARKSENDARVAYIKQLASNQVTNDKKLQDLIDQENKAVQQKQVMYLNIGGAVCLAIFFIGIGFGQLEGLKVVWPFIIFAVMCFGLAQIISQWWFMWACLGVAIIALGITTWWVIRHYKMGTLAADTQKKAAAFQNVVHDVVPVLDTAYETADQAGKELLDKYIFQPLNGVMDKTAKDVVTMARATVNLNTPASATPPKT